MKEMDVISDPNPQVCGMENVFLPPVFYRKGSQGRGTSCGEAHTSAWKPCLP